jgi:hypothetical protein
MSKRPDYTQIASTRFGRTRRACAAGAPVRNLEAAQRSKILFDDSAEIDLSDDLGKDETLALLLDQRRWDSNYGLAA